MHVLEVSRYMLGSFRNDEEGVLNRTLHRPVCGKKFGIGVLCEPPNASDLFADV
jgi:hypothetical protein